MVFQLLGLLWLTMRWAIIVFELKSLYACFMNKFMGNKEKWKKWRRAGLPLTGVGFWVLIHLQSRFYPLIQFRKGFWVIPGVSCSQKALSVSLTRTSIPKTTDGLFDLTAARTRYCSQTFCSSASLNVSALWFWSCVYITLMGEILCALGVPCGNPTWYSPANQMQTTHSIARKVGLGREKLQMLMGWYSFQISTFSIPKLF